MNIKNILTEGYQKLDNVSPTPKLDTEIILAHALNKNRPYLFRNPNREISPQNLKRFKIFIERRLKKEPVAYITNKKEFYGIDFYIDKRVLIPRPETEILVNEALKIIKYPRRSDKKLKIVDVGTGSACIPIALAKNYPHAFYYAVDISQDALQVARINIKNHRLENKIKLIRSNLLDNFNHKADIVTANLPYLTFKQITKTEIDVQKFEPEVALLAGKDEDFLYDKLLNQVKNKISKKAFILLEIAPNFKNNIIKTVDKYFPRAKIKLIKDLSTSNRVLIISI